MIVTLPGASLWLWHFLEPLYDCEISLVLSMIVKSAGATLQDLSMIATRPGPFITVKLPGSSLWLWHFLRPFCDFVLTVPSTSLWLWHILGSIWWWHFLGLLYNWAASSEFGTYRLCEQRRFRRACASAQSRQNLRCSLIQAVSEEEPSDRKPDP